MYVIHVIVATCYNLNQSPSGHYYKLIKTVVLDGINNSDLNFTIKPITLQHVSYNTTN